MTPDSVSPKATVPASTKDSSPVGVVTVTGSPISTPSTEACTESTATSPAPGARPVTRVKGEVPLSLS